MRRLIAIGLALVAAGCQPSTRSSFSVIRPQAGSQTIEVRASPEKVRETLVSSATKRGSYIIQDDPNMVIIENAMRKANPVLDEEFGPSEVGERVIRVRVRFSGTRCDTTVVQDLALINDSRTPGERSFRLPGDSNTLRSLQRLKANSEKGSGC
ncbi:hypothetical protein [Flexibacterium corallicola]|uniref:hypothetical protein n=1 Tax=Flexibacterium corallicola TaxID=3037259 RepID=UPI00286F393D|nr:hypothetical protein [Pseudovibrio sp. M1P-2-3]